MSFHILRSEVSLDHPLRHGSFDNSRCKQVIDVLILDTKVNIVVDSLPVLLVERLVEFHLDIDVVIITGLECKCSFERHCFGAFRFSVVIFEALPAFLDFTVAAAIH